MPVHCVPDKLPTVGYGKFVLLEDGGRICLVADIVRLEGIDPILDGSMSLDDWLRSDPSKTHDRVALLDMVFRRHKAIAGGNEQFGKAKGGGYLRIFNGTVFWGGISSLGEPNNEDVEECLKMAGYIFKRENVELP